MTTPVLIEGFEHGVGTLTTNGGGLCNAIAGSPAVQGTVKRTGNYALQCNPTAATANLTWNIAGSPTYIVYQVWIRVASWPSAATNIISPQNALGFSIRLDPADNKLYPRIGSTNGTPSSALSLDTWYRLDVRCYYGTTGTIEWQLDGVAQTTHSLGPITAGTFALFQMGNTSSVSVNIFYDDLVVSTTSADYPIGPVGVGGLSPSADGTHNAGTNVIEDQTGADIGVVTAWDLIDNDPMSTTGDYVRQAATGTGNYAEVAFADTAQSTILGAQAVLAYHSGGTQANSAQTRIRDGAGQETTVYSGDMSESSLFYKSVIVTPPVAGWSQTTVNALLGRVGYASDANPNPYWDALMIEVAYSTATVNQTVTAVAATASADAIAPVVAASIDATVAGVVGASSAAAVSPTLSAGVNIAGVAGTSTSAGIAPAVSAGANITGVAAAASAAGIVPTLSAGVNITGVATNAPAAGVAPTIQASVTIAGVTATASAAALAPTVSAGTVISQTVNAIMATANAAGVIPALSASANVAGITGASTGAGIIPAVSAGANIAGIPATASASAPIPTIQAGSVISANVAVVAAVSSAAAIVPSVSAGANITGLATSATAIFYTPLVDAVYPPLLTIFVALTLAARSTTFTLNGRSTGLSMRTRDLGLTVDARDGGLTIKPRKITLTMEDR